MIWNPGDDTDLNEGGAGTDTVEVNGGSGAEQFTTTANGTRVRFDRLNPAPFAIDIGTSENLVLNANGGDDCFSATGNLAALIQITVDGGAGNDTLLGSNGADIAARRRRRRLRRRPAGQRRRPSWAPATTRSSGIPATAATSSRARTAPTRCSSTAATPTRTSTSPPTAGASCSSATSPTSTMDLDDVETVDVQALGGADTIVVNDLSGTDVTEVNDRPGRPRRRRRRPARQRHRQRHQRRRRRPGGRQCASVSVLGLAAQVTSTGAERANDRLTVNALAGDDVVDASGLAAGGDRAHRRRRRRRRRLHRRRRRRHPARRCRATTCCSAARASTSRRRPRRRRRDPARRKHPGRKRRDRAGRRWGDPHASQRGSEPARPERPHALSRGKLFAPAGARTACSVLAPADRRYLGRG